MGGFPGVTRASVDPAVADAELAVGPTQLALITNKNLTVLDKFTGAPVGAPKALVQLFETQPIALDPEIIYDHLEAGQERWFACGIRYFSRQFLLAVSHTGDAAGAWEGYTLDVSADMPEPGWTLDSTNMTVDDGHVYVNAVGRYLDPNTPEYRYRNLTYAFSKADFLTNPPPQTLPPVLAKQIDPISPNLPDRTHFVENGVCINDSQDVPGQAQCYFIDALHGPSTVVQLHFLQPIAGVLVKTSHALAVPEYHEPVEVLQKADGGSQPTPPISTVDSKFWSCRYRAGSIWAVHHVTVPSAPSRTIVRWYEIRTNGWGPGNPGAVPTLHQWGQIDPQGLGLAPALPRYAIYPSIGVNANNDACIVYNRCGTGEFLSIRAAIRRSTDPLGTFPINLTVKQSNHSWEEHLPGNAAPWADYSACEFDPSSPTCAFYMHHSWVPEPYGGSIPNWQAWATWVGVYQPCEKP